MAYGAILGQKTNTYNKEQIMTSETAALFGLGTDAVPDNILELLGNNIYNGLGNQYLWEKTKDELFEWSDEEYVLLGSSQWSTGNIPIYNSTSFNVVENGTELVDPSNNNWSYDNIINMQNAIKGKYVKKSNNQPGTTLYQISANGEYKREIVNGYYEVYFLAKKFLGYTPKTSYGYVNSSSPDTYPPTEPDGYTYTALGQLGGFAKIETGSYTGTGTYGSSNPNTLTFEFEPKFWGILGTESSGTYTKYQASDFFPWGVSSINHGLGASNSSNYSISAQYNNFTVKWYSDRAAAQYNDNGNKFYYLAIG